MPRFDAITYLVDSGSNLSANLLDAPTFNMAFFDYATIPIDPSKHEIRLVEILPGDNEPESTSTSWLLGTVVQTVSRILAYAKG